MQIWRKITNLLPRAAQTILAPQATPMPLLKTIKAIVATRATIIESLAKDVQRKDEESGGKFSSQLMD